MRTTSFSRTWRRSWGRWRGQVSPLAELTIELREERTAGPGESQVAEGALRLKGVTLRATERSNDMGHSVNLMADDLARQVKKHRDKRRGRREAHKAAAQEHAALEAG